VKFKLKREPSEYKICFSSFCLDTLLTRSGQLLTHDFRMCGCQLIQRVHYIYQYRCNISLIKRNPTKIGRAYPVRYMFHAMCKIPICNLSVRVISDINLAENSASVAGQWVCHRAVPLAIIVLWLLVSKLNCQRGCGVMCTELQGGVDDRKALGPIGTERASRRPPNMAASMMYPTELNTAMAGTGSGHGSWNMYTDCAWLSLSCH